jgi:hypothetical protein
MCIVYGKMSVFIVHIVSSLCSVSLHQLLIKLCLIVHLKSIISTLHPYSPAPFFHLASTHPLVGSWTVRVTLPDLCS